MDPTGAQGETILYLWFSTKKKGLEAQQEHAKSINLELEEHYLARGLLFFKK